MKKVCKICHEEKEFDEFYFRKDNGKHRNECKECLKKKARKPNTKPTTKEGYKYCAKCNKEKPLEEFNKRFMTSIQKVRPFSYCKECERKYDNNRYSHKCIICGTEYKSGRKESNHCQKCKTKLMNNNEWMYKYKVRDFSGGKNPMFGIQRFGSDNPNYDPTKTQKEREVGRLYTGYGLWRKAVFERDNYTCQCCGDFKGGNLRAHHLDAYSWCKERRLDIENGITLCDTCHRKFHSKYGVFNNTGKQFITFKNNLEYLS